MTLFAGNAVAFVVPAALYPFLSRIFTPEDYALFGLYISAFSLLEIASAGRYDLAVVLPEKDEDAQNIVIGGILISMGYSLFILIVMSFTKDFIATSLHNPGFANWLLVLPTSLFFVSVSKMCNAWLIRKKKFKASSVNKASQKFAEGSTQVALGVILKTSNGLILGDIAGRFFNAILSLYQSINSGLSNARVDQHAIRSNLNRYLEFPKFNIVPSMLNALGALLPVFIVSSYYSVEASGSFNFSRIILSVPFALISAGVSQVLMQQISEKRQNRHSIAHDIFSVAWKLALLSVVGLSVLFLAGPALFAFVFGEKWRLAGEFTSILIFSYAVSFIVSPFSILLLVLEKVRWASLWQTFYFAAVLILWFIKHLSIEKFLTVLVVIDLVSYSVYGIFIYQAIKRYEEDVEHPLV